MNWLKQLRRRLEVLLRPASANESIDAELDFHVEMQTQVNIAAGMNPEEAHSVALRMFGGVDQTKDKCREIRPWAFLETVLQDVRFGIRMLRKNPGFTVIAVLSLALGIGANTAMFSVINAVLLRPLPYKDADRLVVIRERIENISATAGFSAPDLAEFEREQQSCTSIAAFKNQQFELAGSTDSVRISAARATASLFSVLEVTPMLGRVFANEEDRPGANVVILSHDLWQRKFDRDPNILGKTIRLDRETYTIIGVMPAEFEFPHKARMIPPFITEPAELWVPMAFTTQQLEDWTADYENIVLARLKEGVTLSQARQESNNIITHVSRALYPPKLNIVVTSSVQPYQQDITGRIRNLLLILQAAVVVVLLLACVNVANLLFSRAINRKKEISVRTALGASRFRLVRQLLFEGIPLALSAGLLGVSGAWWALKVIRLAPLDIPRLSSTRIDVTAVAFACILCCLVTALFSVAPALRISRADSLGQTLKESGRGVSSSGSHQRLLQFLVVSQFGMGLVLLVAAGLLVRSFVRLSQTDVGFQPDNALTLSVNLPQSTYPNDDSFHSFAGRLFGQLHKIPGVKAVGVATDLPLGVRTGNAFSIENLNSDASRSAAAIWIFGNYFESIGARLGRGRFLTPDDGIARDRVVVVNEGLTRRYFPGQEALGRRIRWGIGPVNRNRNPWMTIVGVIQDIKDGPIRESARPEILQPYLQVPDLNFGSIGSFFRSFKVILRTGVPPADVVGAVREEIRSIDPELAISDLQPLEQYVRQSIDSERVNALVFSIFAMIGAMLAAIGVYGTVSYWVLQRTSEIGIRAALGASPSDLLKLVVKQGMKLALIGITVGAGVSIVLTRFIVSLLYQVEPTDPMALVAVALILTLVAALASYIPASRAARLDPMLALRSE